LAYFYSYWIKSARFLNLFFPKYQLLIHQHCYPKLEI
jgi:hypothetical protein